MDADDIDRALVAAGLMTEDERISIAYQRILAEQLKRRML